LKYLTFRKEIMCSYCTNRKLDISVAKKLACAKNKKYAKNKECWYCKYMKLGLEFTQNLANKRGEICISSSYHNKYTSFFWRCSEGHS
ncbi:26397_t:CDS:2, partial [Racocetra persica]